MRRIRHRTGLQKPEHNSHTAGRCRILRPRVLRVRNRDPSLPRDWYSTSLWTESGLAYIDEAIDSGRPFFWYLAYNGAHFPIQAPEETIAKYRGRYMSGWDEVRNERFRKQKELEPVPIRSTNGKRASLSFGPPLLYSWKCFQYANIQDSGQHLRCGTPR